MKDLNTEVYALTQTLEVGVEEAINYYLNLEDFKLDTRVAWANNFESTKKRFKKVYLDLLNYTSVAVE